MIIYTPQNWYWIVAGDESRFWSSATGSWVQDLPEGAGVTPIGTEAELSDVLRPYGMLGPHLALADYKAAIVTHLDAAAAARLFDSAVSIATYVGSTNPQWAAEAIVFVAWRDAVWAYAYTELEKVMTGQRQLPSVAGFLAELPPLAWPA